MFKPRLKVYRSLATFVGGTPAFAFAGDPGTSNEPLGGFLLLLGFVALVYVVVFLLRVLTRSEKMGPDEMNGVEFDEFTRSVDDTTWRVPDSWPRR